MHEPSGPDPIPAHVHDEPAVRRRVGADAYRAQGPDSIAAALHARLAHAAVACFRTSPPIGNARVPPAPRRCSHLPQRQVH